MPVAALGIRRTWRWMWTGWSAEHSAADRAAFEEQDRERARRGLLTLIVLFAIANVLYWAQDQWAFAGFPDLIPVMARGRTQLLALGAVCAVALVLLPRQAYWIGGVGAHLGMYVLARTLGDAGGPSAPWLYFTLPYFLLTVGAWLPLVRRAALLVTLIATLGLGYFGPHPAYLTDPMTRIAGGHLAYVIALCLVLGVWTDRARIDLFLSQAALARERSGLSERVAEQTAALRSLARRVDSIREAERAALARDLHDDVGQVLTGTRLVLRHARDRFTRDPASIGANLDLVASGLDELTDLTRRLLREYRPAVIDDRALAGAVEALVTRCGAAGGVSATLVRADDPRCTPEVAVAAFRCVQEALTNVVRHARAQQVRVAVSADDAGLTVDVSDDGVGFDPPQDLVAGSGLGLIGMRERVESLGGRFTVRSSPGMGTTVAAWLPAAGVST